MNDFLSEGGKLSPLAKPVAEEVHLLDHLRTVVAAARKTGIRIFFVSHHRWEPGDFVGTADKPRRRCLDAKMAPIDSGPAVAKQALDITRQFSS